MLEDKVILAVDDEPDVLDTISEVLDSCTVETAVSYEAAVDLLTTRSYDMVILDIMGVNGLDLLEISVERGFPSVILTAPATNPEYLQKALERGALLYLPKEDLVELDSLLDELQQLIGAGGPDQDYAVSRISGLFDERYGPDWRDGLTGSDSRRKD